MGYIKVDNMLLTNTQLKPSEILLLSIVDSFDRNGSCFVSNQHLANLLHMSSTQVSRLVSKLVKSGYLHSHITNRTRRTLSLTANIKPPFKPVKEAKITERTYDQEYQGLKYLKQLHNIVGLNKGVSNHVR